MDWVQFGSMVYLDLGSFLRGRICFVIQIQYWLTQTWLEKDRQYLDLLQTEVRPDSGARSRHGGGING